MTEPTNAENWHPGSPEGLAELTRGRHPGTASIVRYFAWNHLPEHLRDYSANCAHLARYMVDVLPDGPELKDCFVRAALDVKP